MTIKLNDEELTLLETITRESLDAFISESSKATGTEYLARCVDQIKVYKSLHEKAQRMCLERVSGEHEFDDQDLQFLYLQQP